MRKSVPLLVRRSPLDARQGIVQAGPLRFRCALGRSGTTIFKREGDGASPVANMRMLSSFRRERRLGGLTTPLAQRRIVSSSGWCDAPSHAAYNRFVRLPFTASAESMQRADRLYDFVVVLDWNIASRRRHLGSAIFLHVAKPGYPPTQGCIALAPLDMRRLAPMLRRNARLRVLR